MTQTSLRPAVHDAPVMPPAPDEPVAAGSTATSPAAGPRGALVSSHLSREQIDELARELDALRAEVIATRGARDAAYIRRVIAVQRGLELGGRACLLVSRNRAAWVAGTGMLSVAKILENMEIGHNVLHGQWDWMRDPDIHSTTWEWDFVTPARAWQHTHNDLHHVWTNVLGKDQDIGYNLLRMDENQPWTPKALGNPLYNAVLAPFFEWGIAIYDLELTDVAAGRKSKAALKEGLKGVARKFLRQATRDYVATPAAAALFGSGRRALLGTFTANAVRNVWAHSVIFCGHFPAGVETFTEEQIEGESRGDWYVRQVIGSANISGSRLMHLMTGNLSFQIEHHLFPDIPSNRYQEVTEAVQDICRRYGLPYTTGPLPKQVASAWAKVCRLALP